MPEFTGSTSTTYRTSEPSSQCPISHSWLPLLFLSTPATYPSSSSLWSSWCWGPVWSLCYVSPSSRHGRPGPDASNDSDDEHDAEAADGAADAAANDDNDEWRHGGRSRRHGRQQQHDDDVPDDDDDERRVFQQQ